MVKLDTFKGHIVLLCKNWYKHEDFFDALKKIWAVRCGYDEEFTPRDVYRHIADDMFEIIQKCMPERMQWIHECLHDEVNKYPHFTKPEGLTPIQVLIWEYRSIIRFIQIRDSKDGKRTTLVQLPRPQKRIFNRILKGEGEFYDYEKITEADEKYRGKISA